jgi:hypothetical protein
MTLITWLRIHTSNRVGGRKPLVPPGSGRRFASTYGRISRSYRANAARWSPSALASSPARTYAPTSAMLVPMPVEPA